MGQINSKDQKSIEKLLGKDYIGLNKKLNYPYSSLMPGVNVDTSTTLIEDTTGIHFNGEYVMFRNYISNEKSSELLRFLKTSIVTNVEYQAFQKFVRDSIAREIIYYNLEMDESSAKYLNYSKHYYDISNMEWVDYDPSHRERNREYFPFDWSYKFHYDDASLVPILSDMYLPPSERFYKNKIFDERKFIFRYYELTERDVLYQDCTQPKIRLKNSMRMCAEQFKYVVDKNVNVSTDDFLWGAKSKHNFDELAAIAQLYSKAFSDKPVSGILGSQAKAFCHWKQYQLQRDFNDKGLNYDVVVTLPLVEDLDAVGGEPTELKIPTHDYSDQWRITREEYNEFVNSVQDSLKRECLYRSVLEDIEAEKLLYKKSNYYFDNGNLEFVEFDHADRQRNREVFSFDYSRKIKQNKYSELNCSHCFDLNKNFYRFYYVDIKERSFEGHFYQTYSSVDPPSTDYHYRYYDVDHRPVYDSILGITAYSTGKDLWLYGRDRNGHDPGIRRHKNYQQFIIEEQIDIMPADLSELDDSDNLIQSISYDQAIAFYRWKYPIQKANEKSDWMNFVLPSKEEFEMIKAGSKIVIDEHNLKYPTPGFRFVVHIFPKG